MLPIKPLLSDIYTTPFFLDVLGGFVDFHANDGPH